MKQPVGLACSNALQRFQQDAGRNRRQQKHVDMIRHHHEGSEMVLAQALTSKQRFDDQCGDRFAPQMHGTRVRSIQIAVHSREGFAIGDFTGWRKMGAGQAAVQMPGEEKPAVIGIDVGKAALGRHAQVSGVQTAKLSRSHECERCTHECVRHSHSSSYGNSSYVNSSGVSYGCTA
jgi:hypothetical protein